MESQPRSPSTYRRLRRSLILALCCASTILATTVTSAPVVHAQAPVSPTPTPAPTPTPTRFPIEIPGELPSLPTPAATATATATRAATPTRTATATPSPSATPSPTATPAPVIVPAVTPSSSQIYLPSVSGSVAEPERTAQEVFGILGQIGVSPTTGAEMLTLASGRVLWLVPVSPAVDRELVPTARLEPAPAVKVWGTLYSLGAEDTTAFIVVTEITESAAEARPAVVASAATTAKGRFDRVNLRAEPEAAATRSGQIMLGQDCTVTGRTADSVWILLGCPNGATGWIEPRFVTLEGELDEVPVSTPVPPTNTPVRTATPAATPTPYVFQGWRALYYPNPNLAGAPAQVEDVPALNFDWGMGAPRSGLPADYFSIAWERTIDFPTGFYIFSVSADDGFRVLLDNEVILDQWGGPAGQSIRVGRALTGRHDVRVEYNEISGAAHMRFDYELQPPPLRWAASYAYLPDVPSGILTQMEADGGAYRLDYNWGNGSPTAPAGDNWSARWVGTYPFEEGTYIFTAQGKDGYRVALDGQVVIDKWRDGYEEQRNRYIDVGNGDHTVSVDYYNRYGPASIRVWWTLEPRTEER